MLRDKKLRAVVPLSVSQLWVLLRVHATLLSISSLDLSKSWTGGSRKVAASLSRGLMLLLWDNLWCLYDKQITRQFTLNFSSRESDSSVLSCLVKLSALRGCAWTNCFLMYVGSGAVFWSWWFLHWNAAAQRVSLNVNYAKLAQVPNALFKIQALTFKRKVFCERAFKKL